MSILDDNSRLYTEDDWSVKRWIKFHGGNKVKPRSFCQFWRTVFLWATLRSIPVIGKLFIPESALTVEERIERAQRIADWQPPTAVKKIGKAIGMSFVILTSPIRRLIVWVWDRAGDFAARVDGWSQETRDRILTSVVAILLFVSGAFTAFMAYLCVTNWIWPVVIPWLLALGWEDWKKVLIGLLAGIGSVLLIILFAMYVLLPFLAKLFDLLGELSHMIIKIMVSGHHKVCPPMKVEWHD